MKRIISVIAAWWVYVLAANAAGTYDSSAANVKDSDLLHAVAMRVNGMPVSGEAFVFTMNGCRTACYDYFLQKYGTYDEADFWQHSFRGEVPAQWLERETVQRCKEDLCRLQVMQCYGVLNGFDFLRFKQQWKEENNRRQGGVNGQQVVYGNTYLDAGSFYSYLLSNAWLEAQRNLVRQHPPTATQQQQVYEAAKQQSFQKAPTVQIRLYQQIAGQQESTVQDILFEPAGRKADELQWGTVYTQSMQLGKAGKRSPPFQNEAGQVCEVECLVWQEHGYLPAADVQENILQLYAEAHINKQLQQLRAGCQVQVNKAICKQLVAGGCRQVL